MTTLSYRSTLLIEVNAGCEMQMDVMKLLFRQTQGYSREDADVCVCS